jgi:hypothetical protein
VCDPKIKTIVETVEDNEDVDKAVEEDAEELFPDTAGTEPPDKQARQPHPYTDPHIRPPKDPPPKSKRQKSREPTARHADDKLPTQIPTQTYHPPKPMRRDWQGASPPVPKQ